MACDDKTPWTLTNHPHTVNRLRVTAGGSTDQSSGEWTPETTSSLEICGSIGRAGTSKSLLNLEDLSALVALPGAAFKTGDLYFICHTDCDVALNDIIEVYEDAAGSTKTYWRVTRKMKTLTTVTTLRGYGMDYWLVRLEER